ncbi:MAG: MoaD/ThiS family protein [Desulfurococcaceae archaeon]
MIRIKIKFFSIYSDYASNDILEFQKPITVEELLKILVDKYPALSKIIDSIKPIILVNGIRVDSKYVVKDNEEVALIPPVSGG